MPLDAMNTVADTPLRTVAVTGGIGSGKSMVCALLAEKGIPVYDSDSRTKALMPEFAKALSLADRVVLAEIYPARETDNLGVHSSDVAALINASEPGKAVALPSFEKIETYLLENLSPGDLCITMGAGDICKVGEMLLGKR